MKIICDFAHTDLKHALKMSRFYLIFITLHNLNQQNRQLKKNLYFVHMDLDTGSSVNICDIEILINFATKKKGNFSQIYITKKKIQKFPFFCFKSDNNLLKENVANLDMV